MSRLVVQSGTTMTLSGEVSEAGVPVSLTDTQIEATFLIRAEETVILGVVTDAALGLFSLTISQEISGGWEPGSSGQLRMVRIVNGIRQPMGVTDVYVS